MILPISKKMEEVLKSKNKIEVDSLGELEKLWFWRKILGAKIMNKKLFEKLTNKTFDFLKNKQEKILQAETNWRLQELSDLVINWKLDELDQNVGDINWEDSTSDSYQENDWDIQDKKESENWNQNWEEWSFWQNENNWKVFGWATAAVGAAWYYTTINRLNKAAWLNKGVETSVSSVNKLRVKKAINGSIDLLKERSKSPKLNRAMKNNLNNSIKHFQESLDWVDGITDDVFAAYQKYGSKIPDKYFNTVKIDPKALKALDRLEPEEITKMLWKSDEIKKFLKGADVKYSDDLVDMLKIAKTPKEFKWISHIAKYGTKLSKMSKWLKWLSAIAVISMWFDVFVYFESMKEADAIAKINELRWSVKRDQATTQLMVGVASLVAEAWIIIWTCTAGGAMWGPIWVAVWLIVWAVTFATSVLLDELHYDKKAFYGQNRYDFIQQERTTIKQSIVNLLESDRLDMNERMKEKLAEDAKESGVEINTMEDAREALIHQEEILDWWYTELQYYYFSGESEAEYEKKLREEDGDRFEKYIKQREEMEKIVSIRMEYIKKYINKDKNSPEYIQMADMIQKSKWINFVQNVLADSKVYYHLQQENSEDYISNYKQLDVAWYKSAYKEKLQTEYPQKFDILQKLSIENPVHFYEIIAWFELSKTTIKEGIKDWTYVSTEKENMEINLDFLEKYNEYRLLWRPIEERLWVWISSESDVIDYRYIEQILLDFDSIDQRPLWDKQEVLSYFSNKDVFQSRLKAKYQASDSTWQNILYSMAREFHWYHWDNTSKDIMDFYSAANQDSTWLYYDNWWRVNQDLDWTQKFAYLSTWQFIPMIIAWLDVRFDIENIDSENMSADEVYDRLIEWEIWTEFMTKRQEALFWKAEGLDSSIEAADQKIITEFKSKAKEIIEREIWYRENKEKYEQKIIDFVKDQSQGREWYLEIPYNMVIEAKKAKIGDIENYLFKYENNQIIALSTWYHINESLNFDKTKVDIDYEALSPLRENLSEQEKLIVEKVWIAHDRLEKIRSLQSWWKKLTNSQRDDLDIPVDIERQISKKWYDRQDIEWSLLYLSPLSAQSILEEKWEEYYNYFQDTYIWIMATVSQFTWGDKMWNINNMNKAFSWSNIKIIDINESDNELFIPENVNLEDDEKYFLLHYIKETTDEETGKTVEELLKSEKDEEFKQWERMSKQILISILESETIVFTENWEIKRIWCNVDPKDERITDGKMWYWGVKMNENGVQESYRIDAESSTKSTKVMEERIKYHLGAGSIVSLEEWLKNIDASLIETKDQKIRKISESEESSYRKIDDMTTNIVSTMEKVDWAGRRWNPKFLAYPEKATDVEVPGKLQSWWTTTDITIFPGEEKEVRWFTIDTWYAKISGLDIKFNNIKEAFRFANIINWIKWHYLKDNPDRKWEFKIRNSWKIVNVKWQNITILKKSKVKDYYSKLTTESNQKKFLNYINNL